MKGVKTLKDTQRLGYEMAKEHLKQIEKEKQKENINTVMNESIKQDNFDINESIENENITEQSEINKQETEDNINTDIPFADVGMNIDPDMARNMLEQIISPEIADNLINKTRTVHILVQNIKELNNKVIKLENALTQIVKIIETYAPALQQLASMVGQQPNSNSPQGNNVSASPGAVNPVKQLLPNMSGSVSNFAGLLSEINRFVENYKETKQLELQKMIIEKQSQMENNQPRTQEPTINLVNPLDMMKFLFQVQKDSRTEMLEWIKAFKETFSPPIPQNRNREE